MFRNTETKLGKILTQEQLIMVERILSCTEPRRLQAVREYSRRPDVLKNIKAAGWDSDLLARITTINHDDGKS